MKIGFDFRMGGAINSGIGRYVFELLKHVLAQDTTNEYVIFYNTKNVDEPDLTALRQFGHATLVPTTIRHYSFAEQLQLSRILQRYDLDLMHFPNFNVPVRYSGPFVVTIHDMVHHKISGHKKSRLVFFYGYKYIINHAAKAARTVITVTNAAKAEIQHFLQVPEAKIRVIYEAPFLEPVAEDRIDQVRQKFLLRRPYFLFVGTLERKKIWLI